MRFSHLLSTILAAFLTSAVGHAATVSLTPTDINGGNTNTSQFVNADVTITATLGGVSNPGITFNDNATRLGMDNLPGTNPNSFNDPDTDPLNGNEEGFSLAFAAGSGLSQLSYDFSRAEGPGPNDGVIISGFTFDPGVTFNVSDPSLFAVYNSGTVRVNIPGALFSGTLTTISFNAMASNGQTLDLRVTDTVTPGAQFAVRGISYENGLAAIPEPSSVSALVLAGLLFVRRRKKVC